MAEAKNKTTFRAFCYASGQIGYGAKLPNGTLPIASGNDKDVLMAHVNGFASRGYSPGIHLVPGIPGAPNDFAALECLRRFVTLISDDLPDGVETIHSISTKKKKKEEA